MRLALVATAALLTASILAPIFMAQNPVTPPRPSTNPVAATQTPGQTAATQTPGQTPGRPQTPMHPMSGAFTLSHILVGFGLIPPQAAAPAGADSQIAVVPLAPDGPDR